MAVLIATCICTMNRPDELAGALRALAACRPEPAEVLVSDDSPEADRRSQAVCAGLDRVRYQRGPRRGLGANRNAAVAAVTADWVHFIDDDVEVLPGFYATAADVIDGVGGANVVVTGVERRHASRSDPAPVVVAPPYAGFWAHFQPVPAGRSPTCVVINAALFPRRLLTRTPFDERLKYGCEESDITCHAIALGYSLVCDARLAVDHYPAAENRAVYGKWIVASQVYAGLKRQWVYGRTATGTIGFLALAVPRLLAYHARAGGLRGGASAVRQAGRGLGYFVGLLRESSGRRNLAPRLS